MKIRIYMAAHKPFDPPALPEYIPIQVGAALHDSIGYQRDDDGINISMKNPYYSELTATYWIWKNDKDSDIIGLAHYRRVLLDDDNCILQSPKIAEILSLYDIILTEYMPLDGHSVRSQFTMLHGSESIDAARIAIEKICPEYLQDFDAIFDSSISYMCNIIIARRNLFTEYAAWLFSIFEEAEKYMDVSSLTGYDAKIWGFLGERMTAVYVRHHKLKVKQAVMGGLGDKVETTAAINEIRGFIDKQQFEEGARYIQEIRESRADLFLPSSDLHHILNRMYLLLLIYTAEKETNMLSGFWDKEYNADTLINIYSEVSMRIENLATNYCKEDIDFMLENDISLTMLSIISNRIGLSDKSKMIVISNLAEGYMKMGNSQKALLYAQLAIKIGGSL